jgi:hypothetical protein
MGKRGSTKLLKEKLVDYLLAHGWKPNKEYWGDDGNQTRFRVSERGCYIKYIPTYDNKTKKYTWDKVEESSGSEHYLISSDKSYALTIKENVVTVHQASRQFCKVLSLKIADIQYSDEGIHTGLLMLRNTPPKEKPEMTL